MAAMRLAIVQNPGPGPVATSLFGTIPAGQRTTADLDAPAIARAVARGRLKVLGPAPDEAPVFVPGEDPGDYKADEVVEFLRHLDPEAPATIAEATRIADAERAGKARSTVLAIADQLATTPDPE